MEAFATLLHVPTGTTLEQGALGGATHDPLHATPRRFVRPMVSVLPTVVRYSIRMCSVRCENQYMMCAVRWSSHVQEWGLPWPYVIPSASRVWGAWPSWRNNSHGDHSWQRHAVQQARVDFPSLAGHVERFTSRRSRSAMPTIVGLALLSLFSLPPAHIRQCVPERRAAPRCRAHV